MSQMQFHCWLCHFIIWPVAWKKSNTIANRICDWHKDWEVEEEQAADTQCSGGLRGVGSGQATRISEKPTVRSHSWAEMQTRLTGQETKHWKKELEGVVDSQAQGKRSHGGTAKSAASLVSEVSPSSSSTWFPLGCATGHWWWLEKIMGRGAKLSSVVTRQTVPLSMFGTHASLLGVFG